MKTTAKSTSSLRARSSALIGVVALAGALSGTLAACSSTTIGSANPSASKAAPTKPVTTAPAAASSGASSGKSSAAPTAGSPVLPIDKNPIVNVSTVKALTIDSVLVENNVGADGKGTDDHLEVALTNSGATDLTGFEVFYTFADPKTGDSENYYVKLPTTFTIAAGQNRVAHFDNTGLADHFSVNDFSLYYNDTNALDVTVEVSAVGAAVETLTVKKDAGGAEQAD